jgi:2-oxoglutarate dehydrogenase E1 component
LAKSSVHEMTGETRFQRLIPEVLHPNSLEALTHNDPATGLPLQSYAGNNVEPRLPYSLVKDSQYPLQLEGKEAAQPQPDGFTLLPPDQIKTVIFCSGQVYYNLYKTRALNNLRHIAIIRLEQLNPFPFWECKTVIDFYGKSLEEIVWCQEEAFNSGAWSFVEPRLHTAIQHSEWFQSEKVSFEEGNSTEPKASFFSRIFSKKDKKLILKGKEWQDKLDSMRHAGGLENARYEQDPKSVRGGRLVRYAGRDIAAAPATGIKKQHKFEEKAFLSEALLGGKLVYPPAKVEQELPVFYQ